MAESEAIQPNLENRPSIFEASASETLDDLIYPALSKLFNYFGLRLDFKLFGNIRVSEDVSPIITWILQYMYLRKKSCSLGESFYGLQRTSIANGELLSKQQQLLSATFLTFMPYLERKLKNRNANHLDTTKWEKLILKAFYVYNASKAVNTFLYLTKYAVSHTPIFRLLGISLSYPAEPLTKSKTTSVIIKVVEMSAFLLQFIQWWYSDENRQKVGSTLKIPKPFKKSIELIDTTKVGICPICIQKITTPTACITSGYVFCWQCIIVHLKHKKSCPVTGYPISIDELVRIYEDKP